MTTDIKINNIEYLVDKFLPDIVRLALVYVKNMEDAEDIGQQVFVTYLHKKPVFIDGEHAKRWLFKVAVNLAKNTMRSKKNMANFDDYANVLFTYDTDYGLDDRENEVVQAVMRLKPSYREVVHLYYYDGYDTNEISKILLIPHATVRTRLARARTELKKDLEGGEFCERQLQKCDVENNG